MKCWAVSQRGVQGRATRRRPSMRKLQPLALPPGPKPKPGLCRYQARRSARTQYRSRRPATRSTPGTGERPAPTAHRADQPLLLPRLHATATRRSHPPRCARTRGGWDPAGGPSLRPTLVSNPWVSRYWIQLSVTAGGAGRPSGSVRRLCRSRRNDTQAGSRGAVQPG